MGIGEGRGMGVWEGEMGSVKKCGGGMGKCVEVC